MDYEGCTMRREFEDIVSRNLAKWERLDKWLATEKLARELIRKRDKRFSRLDKS
jgi:hypothetical protein